MTTRRHTTPRPTVALALCAALSLAACAAEDPFEPRPDAMNEPPRAGSGGTPSPGTAGRGGQAGQTGTAGSTGQGNGGAGGSAPATDAGAPKDAASGPAGGAAGAGSGGSGGSNGTGGAAGSGGMPTPVGPNGMRPSNMLTDKASVIFDDSKVHTVELTMDAANAQKLEATAMQEQFVKGDVTYDGMKLTNIGIRYKGNYTLQQCVQKGCRKSYKLDFAEYGKDQRLAGLKRLNLHVMFNDESFMRERLSYSVARDFGLPASRMAHARVSVNGKVMGLYAVVEAVDGNFSDARFADDKGNIYKDGWPRDTGESAYKNALTNNAEMPNVQRMVRFATALKGATDATFETVLGQWMDVDTMMKTLAVDRAINNWDGPVTAWWCFPNCVNHNFYFYEEAMRDRMWLVLWDFNDTFKPFLFKQIHQKEGLPEFPDPMTKPCSNIMVLSGSTPARPYYCDDLMRRLALLKTRFVAAEKQLVEGVFSQQALQAKLDKWAAQLEPVVLDLEKAAVPAPAVSTTKWRDQLKSLRDTYVPEMVNDLKMRAAAGR